MLDIYPFVWEIFVAYHDSLITAVFPVFISCDGGLWPLCKVIFALPPKGDTDYSMRIWNSDGSEPEMCGNGIRCLAHFIAERDGHGPGTTHRIHTLAGMLLAVCIQTSCQLHPEGQPCWAQGCTASLTPMSICL